MKTPQEHLDTAEELLGKARVILASRTHASVEEVTALATAHISLAMAIPAVTLATELHSQLEETRADPYGDLVEKAVRKFRDLE